MQICLPRYDGRRVEAAARPQVTERSRGNERVLVVEDEPIVLTLAMRILERSGYHVLATDCPREAVRLVTESDEPIDLLVTDVVMPGMSGWELADTLHEHRPDLKVLYVSGYTDDSLEQNRAMLEDTNFLPKPYNATALAEIVREVLDS